jgi:hypothetical protein
VTVVLTVDEVAADPAPAFLDVTGDVWVRVGDGTRLVCVAVDPVDGELGFVELVDLRPGDPRMFDVEDVLRWWGPLTPLCARTEGTDQ